MAVRMTSSGVNMAVIDGSDSTVNDEMDEVK
jgi:hypothetical protein